MNNAKKVYKIIFLAIFLSCLSTGCEDDALLSPQAVDEDEGGSYGLLIFSKDGKSNASLENPEIF
ncbi:MAG: hypothetical protein HOI03_09315 [Candidatus Marinimicrobia bacterium]|jgi:hypothetical protein|nr:hypothetical protein [Candidatus Neomarinimicrobiota bacterium]MDC3246578.1 hypothetical protein [Candidatus Neomarinimicrobiota bacterium]